MAGIESKHVAEEKWNQAIVWAHFIRLSWRAGKQLYATSSYRRQYFNRNEIISICLLRKFGK